ncbi:cold-shock protein [Arthrobacter monumenti]
MATGTVRWFSPSKGYGLIVPDDGGEDVFAHYSAVTGHGYRLLYAGQKVQFEIKQGKRGPRASRIQRLSSDRGR